eukprot:COSAG02_NODE_2333_length_9117_cov_5.841428_7_plen_113_part_00
MFEMVFHLLERGALPVFLDYPQDKVDKPFEMHGKQGFMDKYPFIHDVTDDAAIGLGAAGLTLLTGGLGDAAVVDAEIEKGCKKSALFFFSSATQAGLRLDMRVPDRGQPKPR